MTPRPVHHQASAKAKLCPLFLGAAPVMAGFTSHPLLLCGDNIKAWMPGTNIDRAAREPVPNAGHDGDIGAAWVSQISQDLRPDGDHSNEQRKRCQRCSFLSDELEHSSSPGTEREHSSVFVLESSSHIADAEIFTISMAYRQRFRPSQRSCPRSRSRGGPCGPRGPCCAWQ